MCYTQNRFTTTIVIHLGKSLMMTDKILIFLLLFFVMMTAQSETKPHQPGAFLGGKTTVMPDWFKDSFLDLAEDVADSKSSSKRIMVFFHQDGCPYCNRLVVENFADQVIKDKIQKSLDVIEINMWGDREVLSFKGQSLSEKQFAIAKKVQFTPTLLFFNEQGKQILRLNGYLPPVEFNTALDYVIGKNEQNSTFRQFSQKNQPTEGQLIGEPDMFLPPPYNLQKLAQVDKPFAIFFESVACNACEVLHQNVLSDIETRDIFKQMNLVQLNANSDVKLVNQNGHSVSASALATELKIGFLPTIVFFGENGQEIVRSEAMFKTFHTQSMADYVASGSYQMEKEFQRYLTHRADAIRESGVDVNIWK